MLRLRSGVIVRFEAFEGQDDYCQVVKRLFECCFFDDCVGHLASQLVHGAGLGDVPAHLARLVGVDGVPDDVEDHLV